MVCSSSLLNFDKFRFYSVALVGKISSNVDVVMEPSCAEYLSQLLTGCYRVVVVVWLKHGLLCRS